MSDVSLPRQIRRLRIFATAATVIAAAALLVAAEAVHAARDATFNTLTVHRLILRDQRGRLAMVLTNHDQPMPSVINGQRFPRSGGGGNEIIFYNRLGNEQGGLLWTGQRGGRDGGQRGAGAASSTNVLSFDTVNTDQLLQVDDGDDHGRFFSYITGWNRADFNRPRYLRLFQRLAAAKTPAARRAVLRSPAGQAYLRGTARRYLVGYNRRNTAMVMLADAQGRPRIKMFVTPAGKAELEFLSAMGAVVARYPK